MLRLRRIVTSQPVDTLQFRAEKDLYPLATECHVYLANTAFFRNMPFVNSSLLLGRAYFNGAICMALVIQWMPSENTVRNMWRNLASVFWLRTIDKTIWPDKSITKHCSDRPLFQMASREWTITINLHFVGCWVLRAYYSEWPKFTSRMEFKQTLTCRQFIIVCSRTTVELRCTELY